MISDNIFFTVGIPGTLDGGGYNKRTIGKLNRRYLGSMPAKMMPLSEPQNEIGRLL